ncbi:hypothetical protein [Novosphingobium malaysiense]|uniref:hypothetical protein n=1 Tax=Novosphingobium malaysiense TaxID=1348853 RepID=UPI0012DFF610|nr:hypothetical protein [Novosphingobium malaysiense]
MIVDKRGNDGLIDVLMDLDLSDAIRTHLVIEVDVDEEHYVAEPYALTGPGNSTLRAFVISGAGGGWRDFPDWKNLHITNKRFIPRESV